ncbi:MAG: hypothetical protein U0X39_02925 [Bacteroidales bacterium]
MKKNNVLAALIALVIVSATASAQGGLSLGVNYQAVARDAYGKELVNQKIDVKFSIIKDSPVGAVEYEEVHRNVMTSKYGVFNLTIGKGEPATKSGTFAQIGWETGPHFLKVEVKFDNDYLDMGTLEFLAVPYALFAKKSLEPGPQGPKGDPGDPATDNQTLSFDGKNLSLTQGGGNAPSVVNLSTLNAPHNLSILGDTLSILGGNKVGLPNYMQDLTLDVNNNLKITKNPSAALISLSKYLDNTDNQTLTLNTSNNNLSITNGNSIDFTRYLQQLSYNSATARLSISNVAGEVDLSGLKNDADADPANEIQSLAYDKNTGNLSISSGNSVSLNNSVGFKAKKTINTTGLTIGNTYPLINSEVEFNDGLYYDAGNGSFTAPITGIYTFFVTYKADGSGSSRVLSILRNSAVYEVLGSDILAGSELSKWVIMKLNQGDNVSLTINTGMSTYSGTGSFVGYRNN